MKILLLLTFALACVHGLNTFDGKSSSESEGYTLYPPFEPVKPEIEVITVNSIDTNAPSGRDNRHERTTNSFLDVPTTNNEGISSRTRSKTSSTPTPFANEPSDRTGGNDQTKTNSIVYYTTPSTKNRKTATTPASRSDTSEPRNQTSASSQNSADEFDLRFSKTFFRQNTQKRNVILSPISVRILLAILGEASLQRDLAKRDSKEKPLSLTTRQLLSLAPLLEGKTDYTEYREQIKKSLKSILTPSHLYTLNFGTRIYTLPRIQPQKAFEALVTDTYDATFHQISQNPKNTVTEINNWVKNVTNNKISQLLDADAIKTSVVMLLNTIYFKGLWKYPFNNTMKMEFHTGNGETERKEFVQQVNTFNYAYDPDRKLRIVQMPYEGKKFSMFIILPFENDGLDEVIRNLSSTGFDGIFKDMEDTNVNITLPKFRFDSKVDLNGVVKELGVTEIFTDAAEFPQFTSQGETSKIKVSGIIQSSGIVVDEKGSEAQGATEIELVDKFGGDPRQFIADHPFLFFIQDDKTQAKLFSGVIYNPDY